MKNTLTSVALTIVLLFGATIANAGIIVGGRAEGDGGIIVGGKSDKSCDKVVRTSDSFATGIIVGGRAELGAIVAFLEGIIVGGKATPAPCVEKNGILVSDRDGIIVGG